MHSDPHVHLLPQLPTNIPATARHIDVSVKLPVVMCVYICVLLPYGVDHTEAHLHTAAGVSSLRLWYSRYTIITVTQDLNTQTLMLLNTQREIYDIRLTTIN